MEWAKQEKLQLADQSWEYVLEKHKTQQVTLALLNSFVMPQLKCPLTIWWASERDKGNPL